MKLIALSLSLCLISLSSFSQEKTKVKEVGITFYNFNDYGAVFKIGKEDRFWRFRVLNFNSNISDLSSSSQSQYSFSISAGRERRKSVSEKLSFVYGIELTAGMAKSSEYNNNNSMERTIIQKSMAVGLTGVFGFHYAPSKKWFVQGELLPFTRYSRNTTYTVFHSADPVLVTGFNPNTQFSLGLNNNSVALSIGLKF